MEDDAHCVKEDPPPADANLNASIRTPPIRAEFREWSAETFSKLTEAAQQATNRARQQGKDAVKSLASQGNERLASLLDARIGASADLIEHIAEAACVMADRLDGEAPHLAGAIRSAASNVEALAKDVRGRSAPEIVDLTSRYARRQPAVFVAAAVAGGFLLARLLKSSQENAPEEPGADKFHDA